MTWLVMKRMMKTKFVPLKWASKFTFKIHYWIGWIAVILTAAHATYWLITSFNHRHTWDGISATITIFALAVYGWMMIKSRQKKFMRKLHLTLAIVFLAVLFFHAGEELIQAVIIMLLAWLFVYVVNKYTSKRKTHA
jgi:Ca2+/Na+ antiporter